MKGPPMLKSPASLFGRLAVPLVCVAMGLSVTSAAIQAHAGAPTSPAGSSCRRPSRHRRSRRAVGNPNRRSSCCMSYSHCSSKSLVIAGKVLGPNTSLIQAALVSQLQLGQTLVALNEGELNDDLVLSQVLRIYEKV